MRTISICTKGSRNNKSMNLGHRGARLARRRNAVIFIIFRVFAMQPDGMDRRTKTGSYCFASPKGLGNNDLPANAQDIRSDSRRR